MYQKGNYKAIGQLPLSINNNKLKNKFNVKQPKKLSQKELEKREFIKKTKEIEELEKIQNNLFNQKQRKKNTQIEPLNNNIETKLLKECREMFNDNKNKSNKNNNNNNTKNTAKQQPIKISNINTNNNQNKNLNNNLSNKNNNKLPIKTENNNNNNNSFKDERINSATSRKNIKNNKLSIDGDADIKKDEEFLKNLSNEEKDFYENQTKEVFNLLKSIYLSRFIEDFIKEGYDLYEDLININKNNLNEITENFLDKNQQKKLYNKIIEIKTNKKKPETPLNKQIKNEIQKTVQKEIEPDLLAIEELERQQQEEFKKAVENFRKGKNEIKNENNNNDYLLKDSIENLNNLNNNNNNNKNEMGINTTNINNNNIIKNSEIKCCWNCLKPLKKEECVIKNFNNNFDESIIYKQKTFCSEKCFKEYDIKKKSNIICFGCGKVFDIKNGFILHDGQKFCSSKCKSSFIKGNGKNIINQKSNKNNNNFKEKNKNDNESDYEGDNYDPMDDF